jgi:hypothetical protein
VEGNVAGYLAMGAVPLSGRLPQFDHRVGVAAGFDCRSSSASYSGLPDCSWSTWSRRRPDAWSMSMPSAVTVASIRTLDAAGAEEDRPHVGAGLDHESRAVRNNQESLVRDFRAYHRPRVDRESVRRATASRADPERRSSPQSRRADQAAARRRNADGPRHSG